ncbi:MAG TPA: YdcF family protein [Pirellulaceae bacterium]|nr:YdcF family protein [Pirellulaceae bacterium]
MFWKRRHPDDSYDEYYAERPQRAAHEFAPLWIHFGGLTLFFAAALLVVWGTAGTPMLTRFLKQLIAPVGLVWVGLGLMTYFSLMRRAPWTAVGGLTLWLILTAGGNLFVRQAIVHAFEKPFVELDHSELGHFDIVVVLGGSTRAAPNGRPQIVGGGDRVVTAARLYAAGQISHLVATGRQPYKSSADELDRSQETRQIWVELNIPEDAITTLAGWNTREELALFAQWLQGRKGELAEQDRQRIGLVTSAWHMRRALALARELGLELTPIPCDFWSKRYEPDPSIIVPSADHLSVVAKLLHEWLGPWMNR